MNEIRLREDGINWVETEGEVVALDAASVGYLGVNETGAVLWQALAVGTTREALVSLLLETFDVDEAVAKADVDAFLAELERLELLNN
jgi:hypothetical protein